MKKAIITGITGQDGGYLAKLLLSKGYKVYGLMKRYTDPNWGNLNYLKIKDDVEYINGDLTDIGSLIPHIIKIQPDEFYNLGAQSFVGESWNQAHLTTEVNAVGVLNCLTIIKEFSYILDNTLPEISVDVSDGVAVSHSDGLTLILESNHEDIETVVLNYGNNELELDPEFNETIKSPIHEDFSYNSFSEGEKMRVDLSLLFTWREVARVKNSVNTNLLIMDEVFDSSLDGFGTDEFLKIIRYVVKDANIFVISHKTDLHDKFDNVISFEKIKGFSRIKST
jgi:hypothetical protein